MTYDTYARFPHVRGDALTFVADDNVWLASTDGGRAYRLSADRRPARSPRLSPGAGRVAWTARVGEAQEVFLASCDGGAPAQLTFWGDAYTTVRGWLSDDEVLVVSAQAQAGRERMFAYAVPTDGGPSRRLPLGWAHDLALAPETGIAAGVLLATTTTVEPAWWKHYRGGTAAQLWWDHDGSGTFNQILEDLTSSLVSPVWTRTASGERLGFLSDHEGRGQVYSLPARRDAQTASALTRHTDHELYARHASSDGTQVVYVSGGRLHLLASLDPQARPQPVDIRLAGALFGLGTVHVKVTARTLGTISPDRTGQASAVEHRGRVLWLTHRDGPVRALADDSAVRRRLPTVLGDSGRVAWVSDADGDDTIVVAHADGRGADRLTAPGAIGRVLELAASPDGLRLAAATHDGRLLVAEVPDDPTDRGVTVTAVDRTTQGDMSGLRYSPDSRWLAWSAPDEEPLRHIRMLEVGRAGASPFDVTAQRFTDTEPVFTRDGLHLAFLSVRSLDPVYDSVVFDLSFPGGCRPVLVPLHADTPSPFDPLLGGRPTGPAADEHTAGEDAKAGRPAPPPITTVDQDGLFARLVPAPVAAGRYADLRSVEGALVWRRLPARGELGDDLAHVEDDPPRAVLERLDLATGKVETLRDTADGVQASGDGKRLMVQDGDDLRVVPADHRPDDGAKDQLQVDLSRVRIEVVPRQEWTQMYHEAWRLMRDHYWRPDMGGVDWPAARDRYAPLLEAISTHDELVDLIWEMQAELGSSHAYCAPPAAHDLGPGQGLLGADLGFDGAGWRVDRIVPGESSDPRARSPLAAPGVAMRTGDRIVAVDGRPASRTTPPEALLRAAAGKPVELRVVPVDGGAARSVPVVPLGSDLALRYQDWVNDRRAHVHQQTGGRVGYLHIPDMVSGGWAQLHRDLRTEVGREGLVVDVRGNRGGHTSELVIEKLVRRIIGWSTARGYEPVSYPQQARRGPMVAVADMYAGSDGDIVTAAIQSLGLGPVVGTRTWGGVVGIDGRYTLVDGTSVTQPRFSFWFERFGWGVENHGVDPDIEVPAAPQDIAAGRDVQLDRALREVLERLETTPALQPPPIPPLP